MLFLKEQKNKVLFPRYESKRELCLFEGDRVATCKAVRRREDSACVSPRLVGH
jgi:hypothetical protein